MYSRWKYAILTLVSFVICVIIVKSFGSHLFIRGFVGDVVIVWLLYFLIKSYQDYSPLKLSISVLMLAYSVEVLQYLKLTQFLGLEGNTIANLLLGSVFDWFDILAYTAGAIFVYLLDTKWIRKTDQVEA